MDTYIGKSDNETLRLRAEKILKEKKFDTYQQLTKKDTQKLIYELEVRKIELELQNAELMQALENEKTFRNLFKCINDLVLISEMNVDGTPGKFIMVNDVACKTLGYTREEFLTFSPSNIHSENTKKILDFESTLKFDKKKSIIERELVTKDGKNILFELNINITQLNNKTIFLSIAHDITVRKKTELSLKESEEKYRILFEKNASIQLIIDPKNGRIINANHSALEYYKYNKSEIQNIDIYKINNLPKEEILKEMQNAVLEHRNYFTFQHIKANGEIRNVEVYSTPIKINGNDILYSIIHDVTDRKRAEKALQESEEKYRNLFENMIIGFQLNEVIFDEKGTPVDFKILATNKYFSDFTGLDNNQVIGKTMLEVFPNVDIEMVKKYISVGITGEPLQHEYFSNTFQKHIKFMAYSPKKGQVACIYEDITKQKVAEIKLLNLQKELTNLLREQAIILENSPIGISKIINRNQVWVNKELERIFGFSKNEMIGQTTRILYPSDKIFEKVGRESYPEIAKGLTYKTVQELICKNGEIKSVSYIGKAIDNQDISKGVIWILEDITECKKNELLLRQSENKFKNLINNSGTGIIIINREGFYELVNEKAANQFGITANEIIGKSMFDFLPEQTAHKYFEFNKSLIDSGGRREYEDSFEIQGKSKTFIIVDQCLKDENGRNYAIQSSSIDITDRREAEIALKLLNEKLENRVLVRTAELSISNENLKISKQRYKDLIDLLPQAVYEADMHGTLTYANNVAYELFGYTQDDFNEGLFVIDMIIPEHREMAMKRMPKVFNNTHSTCIEYTALKKDGTTFPVLIYANAINQNNKPVGLRGVIIDLSEIKQAEKLIHESESRLQKLIDSVTDYIYSVKIENDIVVKTSHGEGCLMVTGYSKDEFEKDESLWFNCIFEEDKETVIEHLSRFFLNEQSASFDHRITHKNGKIIWVKNTIVLHHDSNKTLIGYDGLITNITNNKMLEQQMLNLIIETEEKERLNFSQELHEGVGPLLSASKLYLEWLAKTNDLVKKEEINQDLENLLNEASRVIREISFRLSPHVLNKFGVVYAINLFIEKINCTSTIQFNFESNIDRRIKSNIEVMLYRVLSELINNSVKHSEAKNVSISIHDYESKIDMRYSDDGIGFDVLKIKNVTEGVGLFNMHNRINTLGGSFSIKSAKNEGINVQIVVPIN